MTARIKFLRAARRAEIKRGLKRSGSGANSTSKRPKGQWFLGELAFLDVVLHPAPTVDSITTPGTNLVCGKLLFLNLISRNGKL